MAQGIDHPVEGDELLNRQKSSQKASTRATGEQLVDEVRQRVVVVRVRVHPAGMNLCLAHRLLNVLLDPVAELLGQLWSKWLQRPGAEERLVNKVLVVAIRRSLAVDPGLLGSVLAAPGSQGVAPAFGNLGEHVQTRSNVGAALGIVGDPASML